MPDDGKTGLGLDPEVEGVLAYAFVWISGGLLLWLEKKDEEVRFHAAQSIVVFLPLNVLGAGTGALFPLLKGTSPALAFLAGVAFAVLVFLTILLWLFLMIRAWTNRPVKLPVAGEIALRMAKRGGQAA
jgi:uncharacterized membrane protein